MVIVVEAQTEYYMDATLVGNIVDRLLRKENTTWMQPS